MSGVKYSLAPTARCPFGWPAVPNYPIDASPPSLASRRTSGTDDDVVMTDGTAAVDGLQDPVSLHGDDGEGVAEDETLEEELSRRYLEALFDDGNAQTRSPVLPLATRLRALASTVPQPNLEALYRTLILPEDVLAGKWRVTIPDLVNGWITGEVPTSAAPEDAAAATIALGDQEKRHLEEAVRKRQKQIAKRGIPAGGVVQKEVEQGEERPGAEDDDKVSFVKPPPVRDWVDGWAAREAQLQTLLVLELLVLRRQTSADDEQAPLIPTAHATSAPSSPSKAKHRPPLARKGVSFSDGGPGSKQKKGLIDLELLLEGLVDRMAMWQVIGGLGDALLGDLLGLGGGKGKGKATDAAGKDKEAEMDEVQRFWTDVVEEYYADSIPSLTPSLRPKLFPTSFLSSDLASSIVPTPFRSKSKPRKQPHPNRTPNLKSLERRAVEQAVKEDRERLKATMSPTMAKLLGTQATRAREGVGAPGIKRSRSGPGQVGTGVDEGQGPSRSVSSRSLFSKREVSMARKPSKVKLDFAAAAASKDGKDAAPVGVWGQKNLRVPKAAVSVRDSVGEASHEKGGMSDAAARRKQTSPRKSQPAASRTLVLATPQIGRAGSFSRIVAAAERQSSPATEDDDDGAAGEEEAAEEIIAAARRGERKVLVPDTPAAASRRTTSTKLLVPDTPA